VNIRKTKKDIPKGKTPFFFTLKTLSNKQQLFLLHRHFNTHDFIIIGPAKSLFNQYYKKAPRYTELR